MVRFIYDQQTLTSTRNRVQKTSTPDNPIEDVANEEIPLLLSIEVRNDSGAEDDELHDKHPVIESSQRDPYMLRSRDHQPKAGGSAKGDELKQPKLPWIASDYSNYSSPRVETDLNYFLRQPSSSYSKQSPIPRAAKETFMRSSTKGYVSADNMSDHEQGWFAANLEH